MLTIDCPDYGLEYMNNNNFFLRNGSKIAIIGGGPAGSFFAHFASRYAKEMGIDVSLTIFDKRISARPGKEVL